MAGQVERFCQLLMDEKLDDEMRAAMKFVSENVPIEPKGVACSKKGVDCIKKAMGDADGAITVSGSLAALNLPAAAVRTYDVGRIQWLLSEYSHFPALKRAVGPIVINYDQSKVNADQQWVNLIRLDKDAEVNALCLVIYWTKSPDVLDGATDLIFEFMRGGLGSRSQTKALKLINTEESKRKAML